MSAGRWVEAGDRWVNLGQVCQVKRLRREGRAEALKVTFCASEQGRPLERVFTGEAAVAIVAALEEEVEAGSDWNRPGHGNADDDWDGDEWKTA